MVTLLLILVKVNSGISVSYVDLGCLYVGGVVSS